ncbi:MAG: adenosine deaminase [Alphaproteobacteria bacterium]|nr:adenosine deaminase [Alphaproteobacteria bacterium]
MAKAVADDYLRRIPKAELHCHLAGTLRATTVAELAKRAGLALPRPADKLYQWPDFYGFLDVLRLTALVLRTPEDFSRAVYEYVEDAVRDGNLRHVEFFFNPDYFYPNGIDYPAMVDGMVEGIELARKKFGVSSLLICCIDRSTNTPAQAVEIVETAIAHRRDHVVGIGLDGAERAGPPATFAEAYALAKRGGLHRTAHCCEDNQTLIEAPPTNYLICRDVLQCDRIDHGYNMLASDFVIAEARRDGLYFTPCAWTSLVHNRPHRPQRIRRMVEAGLNVTINTDDPAMFETNLGHGFTTLFESIGWGPDMARKFSLNSVEGSWLDESDKSALRLAFRRDIAQLDKEFGYQTAAPTV